ncbi:hypothetical protein GH851_32185, partial [Bacillus thuringiensis]|nr:hypothetical protein [Bacillus thuringiensis]
MQTSKNLADLEKVLKENPVAAAVIIPTMGGNKDKAGFHMRELSILYDIPLFTSVDTFAAYVSLLKNKNVQVKA